jgi:hypothetical protein
MEIKPSDGYDFSKIQGSVMLPASRTGQIGKIKRIVVCNLNSFTVGFPINVTFCH